MLLNIQFIKILLKFVKRKIKINIISLIILQYIDIK